MISSDISRLKALLRLASSRLQVLKQRLDAQARMVRSQLYKTRNISEKQVESLARVQMLIRDDYLQEAYTILESHCCILLDNLGDLLLFVEGKSPHSNNESLAISIGTLVYAAEKITKVPELKAIKDFFPTKTGDHRVDTRFSKKISVTHFGEDLCQKYLETIYSAFTADSSLRDDSSEINSNIPKSDDTDSLELRFSALRKDNH
jgi:hypothetical protein